MSFIRMVIDGPVHRLALEHALVLLKEIQSPIDGRFVDVGGLRVYMVYYFLGRQVITPVMNIIQDHPTRLGKSETFLLQSG